MLFEARGRLHFEVKDDVTTAALVAALREAVARCGQVSVHARADGITFEVESMMRHDPVKNLEHGEVTLERSGERVTASYALSLRRLPWVAVSMAAGGVAFVLTARTGDGRILAGCAAFLAFGVVLTRLDAPMRFEPLVRDAWKALAAPRRP